ncbi:Ctr copper transporter family-domain-containing protein [Xylaria sp. CBS 124048]|nr:Ctr copper transporter family-domain-containing protein [Xylaria sp. CBS 124048]
MNAINMPSASVAAGVDTTTQHACKVSVNKPAIHKKSSCALSLALSHALELGCHTIDGCFVFRAWHIHSRAGFAGLCIGTILIVFILEGLRHGSRQYNRYIIGCYQKQSMLEAHAESCRRILEVTVRRQAISPVSPAVIANGIKRATLKAAETVSQASVPLSAFDLNLRQKVFRALIHTAQLAVTYLIMFLAMSYNGFIIICIILGAFLGNLFFHWDRLHYKSESAVLIADNSATFCSL